MGRFHGTPRGDYGVDRANKTAWALLNHNSDFGVVPEPPTAALIDLGSCAMLFQRRFRSLFDSTPAR